VVTKAKLANPDVNFRYVVYPEEDLPVITSLDFRADTLETLIEIGIEAAKKVLKT